MWQANPEVLVTDLDGELVLMHPARSEMFGLNAPGRLLWQALPRSEAALAELLAGHYGLPAGQARADVAAVLTALQDRGLARPT
ncbi:PqqD family protein [Deinococcus petrolearius]|uniref:PqqD family protein n=1 Tax=Deinococcus petrolearius TaxID=1751295 RepID=A0ABW1DFX0_9DEIO